MKIFLFLIYCYMAGNVMAQRTVVSINSGWHFSTLQGNDNGKVKLINFPHTWNINDIMDDEPGYYRGPASYKRKILIEENMKGKSLFLHFEAANQVASVFVNGQKAGTHTGGYTAFYIPVTHLVKYGVDNELEIRVDNSHHQDIPPLSADFTFYGGIYRDAWLIAMDPIHFAFEQNSPAVYIQTPLVSEEKATVQVKVKLQQSSNKLPGLIISSRISNRQGKIIGKSSVKLSGATAEGQFIELPTILVRKPLLWSPETPQLYDVVSEIREIKTGKLLDLVSNQIGFRWFYFDADRGFFLNGKSLKLIGTSRHQDYKGLGNAVPDTIAIRDLVLLKEMGGNFLRVAHYPQDPSVLAACDSLGILASVEIPIVNEISETAAFRENSLRMQEEMIRQSYNHPSVIIWCYMNEVLLRPRYNQEKERQTMYFKKITSLARSLDSLTRKLDPFRYTMMAHHGNYKVYKETSLIDIPMIVGWNLYSGWYGGQVVDFPVFLDSFHARHPNKPMLVSEYGADADPRIRSLDPVRFDKSVDYTTSFHQFYWSAMRDRPFVAAAMIWNLADFHSETRSETMPHINNKGLLGWDRRPKDPYYYYQAVLSPTAYVKILPVQPAIEIVAENKRVTSRQIVAVTNRPALFLWVNDSLAGMATAKDGICSWNLMLPRGDHKLLVNEGAHMAGIKDSMVARISFETIRERLSTPSSSLNVLLGGNRYFQDAKGQQWIPDQPYRENSWGSIGGKPFKVEGNNRLPYGTDKNIRETDNDPIYQTQVSGIERYKWDVATGNYEITLHFSELMGGHVKELPYNLNDKGREEEWGPRIFQVYVNDVLWLDHFDIAAQYGLAVAVQKRGEFQAVGDKGLEIRWEAIKGEPVLNAIQIKRIN